MNSDAPLAYRMRPRQLDEVIGQSHLVAPGKIIWRMVHAQKLSSMILYGPPGIGKTSIASAIAGSTHHAFRQLNAATDNKKALQAAVDEAKFSGGLVLLLDEIHRLDKTKQDYLLPHLEKGTLILIGATTENPYLSINPAIRSRTQIFPLHPLSPEDILQGLDQALADKERGLGDYEIQLDEEARQHFAQSSNGDLRASLNALELAVLSTEKDAQRKIRISLEIAEECLQKKAFSHDSNGDLHYDVISAFQKSIRGSDVDAALLYGARLIEAGDLQSLVRRLIVCAYEDVGLANPEACQRAVTACEAALKVGLPEARIPLANAIIDLSLSPKSNSAILAIDVALTDVRTGKGGLIPDYLKDAHYVGAKNLGHGVNYLYPHDYPSHWVKQAYLPETLRHRHYYKACHTGAYEQALDRENQKRRQRS